MPNINLHTYKSIAERYKITRQRVSQLARERGIEGYRLGNLIVFTPEQVEQLRPKKNGRPRKRR